MNLHPVKQKRRVFAVTTVVFIKDGNGFVSTAEIKYVLNRLQIKGEVNKRLFKYLIMSRIGLVFTDDELSEMVQEADIDGDQHVSFEEFKDIFNEG